MHKSKYYIRVFVHIIITINFVCYIIQKEKKPKLMLFEKRGVVDFGQVFLNPLTTELSAHSSNAPLHLNSSTPQSRETSKLITIREKISVIW